MSNYPDFNNIRSYNPPSQYTNINDPGNQFTTPLNLNHQNNNNILLNTNQLPPVAQNQTHTQISLNELEVNNLKVSLKSNGQFISCPYCKHLSISRAEQQCSVKNVLCCVLTGPIAWLIFQAARGKDINCYDSEHHCVRCGNRLAEYKAC